MSTELVQVAAVTVAMLTDVENGSTALSDVSSWDGPFDDVAAERFRQEDKWGPQHHTAVEWAMILLEELGEWASDLLDTDVSTVTVDAESRQAAGLLRQLARIGNVEARAWCENHEWPARQQSVYDGGT